MNKRILCLAAFLSAAAVLSGCASSDITYPDSDQYTVGGAELKEDVSQICIGWVSGEIEIQYHEEDTIVFSESANQPQTEKETMRYWLDDDTLNIQFMESGERCSETLEKKLTLYLPEHLDNCDFEIHSVSADISMDGLTARTVDVNTTSGDFTAALEYQLKELDIDTVSGNVDVQAGAVDSFEMDSVSGEIKLSVSHTPKEGTADSVSGNIMLYLPEDASFRAEAESVSGSVYSDFGMKENEKDGLYICGDGESRFEIDTVSGDICFIAE